ncbi:MAG: hypothetical protein P4M11_08150 [Candidatus Pacebacteria bacterium]|nr:hypothetical protein [Candidatus Paceibacterota bacterium]
MDRQKADAKPLLETPRERREDSVGEEERSCCCCCCCAHVPSELSATQWVRRFKRWLLLVLFGLIP